MTSHLDLMSYLDIATQRIQRSQDGLDLLRSRLAEASASPELIDYLDGLQELLTVTANTTRDIAHGLQEDFGQRPGIDEYQY